MPAYLNRVYRAFTLLSGTRDYSANGAPLRIKLAEVKAYLELYPSSDPHWFIDLLLATDAAFIDGIAEQNGSKKRKDDDKPRDPRMKRR